MKNAKREIDINEVDDNLEYLRIDCDSGELDIILISLALTLFMLIITSIKII